MSIIALARIARPLRPSCTRYLSRINTSEDSDIEHLIDAHDRKMTRLYDSYQKKIDELWKQVLRLKSAKFERELREMRKPAKREREEEESTRSLTELELTHDKIQLLHRITWYKENISAVSSLDIIDSIYRRRLDDTLPPGTQSVLSAIINGALDEPSHTYVYSRQKAISLLDPTLQKGEVDEAGHHLYSDCLDHVPIQPYRQPIDLKEGQLPLASVAAFFALAHWSRVDISGYYLKSDGQAVRIEGRFEYD